MDRRGFLKALGVGAAAAMAPGLVLAKPEPVRRYWQVPRNAPVGGVEYTVQHPGIGAGRTTFELPDGSGRIFMESTPGPDSSFDQYRKDAVDADPNAGVLTWDKLQDGIVASGLGTPLDAFRRTVERESPGSEVRIGEDDTVRVVGQTDEGVWVECQAAAEAVEADWRAAATVALDRMRSVGFEAPLTVSYSVSWADRI
jgi:hypothetical protein